MGKHRFHPGVTPVEHRASRILRDRNQRAREALILSRFIRSDYVLAGAKGGTA